MAGLRIDFWRKAADRLPTRPFNQPVVDWGAWREPNRPRTDPASLITDGYAANSAVFACVQTLVRAFVEPQAMVYEADGTPVADHPLLGLLHRPNTLMSEGELWGYLVNYAALGGNGYLYKVRPTASGPPAELWPYHAAQIAPVPSALAWVDHYAYALGDDRYARIEPGDLVHWKWAPDPRSPWAGFAPLVTVVRELATDSELTRYLQALLVNDAVPRGILKFPAGSFLTTDEQARLKADWGLRHGGQRRGGLALLFNGAAYERVALNLQELAFDALRGVPEARIAAAFGVPAIVAGLNIGLARSTYSNYEEARKAFTEQTLVPLWASLADELTADLLPEFDQTPGRYVAFDLTHVVALREGADKQTARMVQAYQAGIVTQNEARAALGYESVPTGDVFANPIGPPDLPLKALAGPVARPRKSAPARATTQARMERALTGALAATVRAAADHLEGG